MTASLWHLSVQHIFTLGLEFCEWQVQCHHNNLPCIQSLCGRGNLPVCAHNFPLYYSLDTPAEWPSFRIVFLRASPGVFRRSVPIRPYHLRHVFGYGVTCIITVWLAVMRPFFVLGDTPPSISSITACISGMLTLAEATLQADIFLWWYHNIFVGDCDLWYEQHDRSQEVEVSILVNGHGGSNGAGGVGRYRRRRTRVNGCHKVRDGQGGIHCWIYGEYEETELAAADGRLYRHWIIVDLVDVVHQRVIVSHPEDLVDTSVNPDG